MFCQNEGVGWLSWKSTQSPSTLVNICQICQIFAIGHIWKFPGPKRGFLRFSKKGRPLSVCFLFRTSDSHSQAGSTTKRGKFCCCYILVPFQKFLKIHFWFPYKLYRCYGKVETSKFRTEPLVVAKKTPAGCCSNLYIFIYIYCHISSFRWCTKDINIDKGRNK